MHNPDERSSRTLETVARACDVLTALEELDGAGVTELAEFLDLSKSSVHSYLATLRDQQFVVKSGDTYKLGLEFLYLGTSVRENHVLYKHGKDVIENLADETGEYVHLMTEQHGLERNVYKVAGENAIGNEYHTLKQQRADFLHFSSTGKAVLAHLEEEHVEHILDQYGLVGRTEHTITDRSTLYDELERIREQGYAVNDEEEIRGIRAVGAPIIDSEGRVRGALSISGPTSRFDGDFLYDELPQLVTSSANIVEANINMSSIGRSL